MRKAVILALTLLTLLTLPGCASLTPASTRAPQNNPADLVARVEVNGTEVCLRMGVVNEGDAPVPAIQDLTGTWELRYLDGSPRARAEGEHFGLPRLPSGNHEPVYLLSWSSELEPGEYGLTWDLEGFEPLETRFRVRASD